jgi:uncharacterized lipoprotein YbaY
MNMRMRGGLAVVAVLAGAACGGRADDTAAPLASIAVTAPAAAVEAGAPVELSYRFERTPDGAALPEGAHVFVHLLDDSGRLKWTDDHAPAVATSTWGKEPITYQRTMFVPRDLPPGRVRVEAGLYAVSTGTRIPLDAPSRGDRAYDVASFSVRPSANTVIVSLDAGWHGAEQAEGTGSSWRWSTGRARLLMRNPRRNVVLWLEVERPPVLDAQTIDVRIADVSVATVALPPGRTVQRVPIPADRFGALDEIDMEWRVSPTFVPAAVPALASQDRRELGVRLDNIYVQVE